MLLPVDLHDLNFPREYSIIYGVEILFIKNGLLCDLTDVSNQVSSPPPRFSILPAENSTAIGPRGALGGADKKTIEIKLKSFSNIPSHVSLDTSPTPLLYGTFEPSEINLPASGWGTTCLLSGPNLPMIGPLLKPYL